MSILVERATSEAKAAFFHKNRWVISRLLGGDCAAKEEAEEKPKRKRKTKSKAKAKAKSKPKAKLEETPVVEEKKTPEVDEASTNEDAPTTTSDTVEAPASASETSTTPDDLTQINGLGPKMAESLTAAGITTFAQLANLSSEEVATLGANIRGFASAYDRKEFKQQAETFAG